MVLPSDSSWSLPAMVEVYLAHSAASNSSTDIWQTEKENYMNERTCLFDCKYVFIFYGKIECWLLFLLRTYFAVCCSICSVSFMMSLVFLFFRAIKWLRTKRVHILSHLMVKCFNKKVSWVPKSFKFMKMPNRYRCKMDTFSGNDEFCHGRTWLEYYGGFKCMLY